MAEAKIESPAGDTAVICLCMGPFPYGNMAIRHRILHLAETYDMTLIANCAGDLREEVERRGGRVLSLRSDNQRRRITYWETLRFAAWAYRHARRAVKTNQRAILYSFQETTSLLAGRLKRRHPTVYWAVDFLDDPGLERHNWLRRQERGLRGRLRRTLLTKLEKAKGAAWQTLLDLAIVQGADKDSALPLTLASAYGIDTDRMIFVPNGYDERIVAPSKLPAVPPLRLFYVGNVSALRGIDVLVQAVEVCITQGVDVEVVLAGPCTASELDALKSLCPEGVRQGKISFVGRLDSDQVWRQIQGSHVGTHPFVGEELAYVYPVKVFEYLALGRPVLASNMEGVAAIVKDGVNGWLVEPGNIQAWADKIKRLAEASGRISDAAAQARSSIIGFEWPTINQRITSEIDRRLQEVASQ